MNRPYRSRRWTMSVDSGASAYSQTGSPCSRADVACFSIFAISTGGYRSRLRARFLSPPHPLSVDRVVVGALVTARPFLVYLHQHVVQERRGADPEQVRRHPVGPERLVQQHEVLDRLLALPDAAGDLDPDAVPGLVEEVARRLHHAQRGRELGADRDLAGRGLDEVG